MACMNRSTFKLYKHEPYIQMSKNKQKNTHIVSQTFMHYNKQRLNINKTAKRKKDHDENKNLSGKWRM